MASVAQMKWLGDRFNGQRREWWNQRTSWIKDLMLPIFTFRSVPMTTIMLAMADAKTMSRS
jgi:hypothetical protein